MSTKPYVEYEVRSGYALIALDNPPVNALNSSLIEEFLQLVERGEKDDAVKGFIVYGRNGKFSGGADITAFKEALKPGAKRLRHLLDRIENSPKSFVAAIDGVALGGALELALTMDHRCATPSSKVAFPEIRLGLLPGAGGTQRLPRLVGQQKALEIILSGDHIPARNACELGIIDEVVEGDLTESAIQFADRRLAALPKRRISALPIEEHPEIIAAIRAQVPDVEQGGLAHHRAIDCIEMTAKFGFSEGMAAERRHFDKLYQSSQAQSRIHLFFAERNVAKIPSLSPEAKALPIRRAAVVGAGTMGSGIAINFLNAGVAVTLIDTEQQFVDRALKSIQSTFAGSVKKGRMQQKDMDKVLELLKTATTYDDLGDVDIVVEAVFENMQIKQDVFRQLDSVCRESAILASNTSTLDIDQLAAVVKNPGRVIGMHFFSPANVMKLLEVVRGKQTSDVAIATALALGKSMKKVAVLVGNCDGFVGNRMLNGYVRESELLLEEGALPEQIDRVMREFGFAMGPFAVGDLAGIDVHARIRQEREARGATKFRDSKISNTLYEKGRYGQKTLAGWYRYEPGSRTPIVDDDVTQIIIEESKRLGVKRTTISDSTIIKRCMYPLVNEGARILEEGMAIRSSDIDIIWIYGYGFPTFRGGPMFWADTIGLKEIVNNLKSFQKKYGDFWKPAPLLLELAEKNQMFSDYKGAELCAKP
ncbi:MAG TPA: 3-hydroxyacyl-CoA dehydrogenase NAD-binding domain-containing protein [Oculatellaceae cyanobacterium]